MRGGVHLIGIVMGGRTAVRRDMEMTHLLDTSFAQIEANPTLVARGPVPWAQVADVEKHPAVGRLHLAASPEARPTCRPIRGIVCHASAYPRDRR